MVEPLRDTLRDRYIKWPRIENTGGFGIEIRVVELGDDPLDLCLFYS